jgi:hypothetical protein
MATTIINSMRVKPFCSFVISEAPVAVSFFSAVTPRRLVAGIASGVPGAAHYVTSGVA